MLNEGSEAEPWCPPGLNSVGELSVVTAGKNILQYLPSLKAATQSGITFTPQDDGGIKVQGTASAMAFYNLDFGPSASSAISDARPFIGTQVTVSIHGGEASISHLRFSTTKEHGRIWYLPRTTPQLRFRMMLRHSAVSFPWRREYQSMPSYIPNSNSAPPPRPTSRIPAPP